MNIDYDVALVGVVTCRLTNGTLPCIMLIYDRDYHIMSKNKGRITTVIGLFWSDSSWGIREIER